jgi:hypothetical protein
MAALVGGSAGGTPSAKVEALAVGLASPEAAVRQAASVNASGCRVLSVRFALHRTNRVMRDSETLPIRAAAGTVRGIPWQVRT